VSKRILIVDDFEIIVTLLRETLAPLGYEVLTTNGGATAAKMALDNPFDLMILDYNLGASRVTGLELCLFMRQQFRSMVIIIISGMANQDDIREIQNHCADEFVEKPFQPMKMLRMIEGYLGDD